MHTPKVRFSIEMPIDVVVLVEPDHLIRLLLLAESFQLKYGVWL